MQTYTVAQRFADSAQDLSTSITERDRFTVQVQELERELAKTKLKLVKALVKASSSSKKNKRAIAKAAMLQERVTSLETELEGAKATIIALQGRVTSLEVDKAAIEYRSIECTLYGVWRQDPNFDFSSFGEHAVARAAGWNARGKRP